MEPFGCQVADTLPIPDYIPATASWLGASNLCRTIKPSDLDTEPLLIGLPEIDTCTLECIAEVPTRVTIAEAYSVLSRQTGLVDKLKEVFRALLLDWSIAFSNQNLTRPLLESTIMMTERMRQNIGIGISPALMKSRSQLPKTSLMLPSGGLMAWNDAPVLDD